MYLERRNQNLKDRVKYQKLDGILITCPENILYLSGLDSIEGNYFLYKDGATLFTDFRYFDAIQTINPFFTIIRIDNAIQDLTKWLKHMKFKAVGFESENMSYAEYTQLKEALSDIELIPCKGMVEDLRITKDKEEQDLIRESIRILGNIMDKIPEIIHKNDSITERELAVELDYMLKRGGAKKTAFDTIVTTGKRAAYPHSVPDSYLIGDEAPLLVDCGAVYRGYHSDMTRVMLYDYKGSERINEIYSIVREAQKAAIEKVSPGIEGRDIDLTARGIIEKAGYKEQFGHGTGHGVGLMVHEGPKINHKSNEVLKPGMIFTIEPGIYLKGEFGIRWEDMILVTEDGHEILTTIKWDNLTPN